MKRRSICTLLAAVVTTACVDQPTAPQTDPNYAATASSNRYIVAFKSANALPGDFAASVAALGGTVDLELGAFGGAVVSGLSAQAVKQLAARRDVLEVNPEYALPYATRAAQPQALIGGGTESVAAPNTAILYAWQWNLLAISTHGAWAAGRLGSATVTAAILDTGLDPNGLDQASLIDLARSVSFIPDDDAVVQTLYPGRNLIADLDGHGTNVGSIVSSNATAFAGVTSRTRLMGVKVCSWVNSNCPFGAVLAGIAYAVDHGADVINISLGGDFPKRQNGAAVALFNRAFQYAENHGVVVVVAAGNDGMDLDHNLDVHHAFCDQTHAICVAASGAVTTGPAQTGPFGDLDLVAPYSNYGRSRIDFAAPGGSYLLDNAGNLLTAGWIWSLCTRAQAARLSDGTIVRGACSTGNFIAGYIGTSQASPHVAGLAALLVSEVGRNPSLIRDLIKEHADDLGQSGTDPFYGKGRINVFQTHL